MHKLPHKLAHKLPPKVPKLLRAHTTPYRECVRLVQSVQMERVHEW